MAWLPRLVAWLRNLPGPGLTARGWVALLGGVLWCFVAWLLGQRDVMWPGIFLGLLPLASWLLLAFGAGRPRLLRSATPLEVAAGEDVVSRLHVDTDGLTLAAAASYRDETSRALHGVAQSVFPLGFGADVHRMEHRLTPAWRGHHRIGPLHRTVTDGLGLAHARRTLPGSIEILALPAVHPLTQLREASGLGTSTESNLLKTSLVGKDDVLVREYAPGDDVRRIHWRSTARTGELMVRREERAWDPSAVVLVDNRRLAFTGRVPEPRFEWLVSAAASISSHLLGTGFSVALGDADGLADDDPAAPGAAGILRRLAALDLSRTGSLDKAMAGSAGVARGQLLVALLGRLDDDDATYLADAHREHKACWALLPEPVVATGGALRLLEGSGWKVVLVPAGASVAEGWSLLGEVPAA